MFRDAEGKLAQNQFYHKFTLFIFGVVILENKNGGRRARSDLRLDLFRDADGNLIKLKTTFMETVDGVEGHRLP